MQSPAGFTDYISGQPLSADTVTKLINRQLGSTRVGIRVQVTDTLLHPVDVYNGNNSDASDITDLVDMNQTCSVTHDTTQPIHRSFTFSMRDPRDIPGKAKSLKSDGLPSFPINPYQNFVRLWYLMSAGGVNLQVSLGYYKPVMPKRAISPASTRSDFVCQDLTTIIGRTDLMSDWTVAALYSGGYVGAMKDLLMSDSIPASVGGKGQTPSGQDDAGPGIPANLLQFSTVGNIDVPAAYLLQAQTNRVDAVNTLAGGVNFYPIWNAPGDGSFRTSQMPYYGDSIPPIGWDYSPMPETSIIEIPINQDFSSNADTRVCNVVRVVSASTASGAGAFSYVAVNDNPNSVVSTVNQRGLSGGPLAIVRYENNSQLLTQDMVELRAKILLQQGAMLVEQVTMSSLPNPLHEDHDLLTCSVTQMDGTNVIPSSADSPFEEQSWSIDLRPQGRMAHTLQRVVPI